MLNMRKGVRGLFLKLPSTEVVDLVAASGLDFAVVDMEHSQLSEPDAQRLIAHGRALGFPVLARLPELDRGLVNRLLEAGAAGIQLSTVRRALQVRELRAATRYAPHGTRSISLTQAPAGYGATGLGEFLQEQRAAPPFVIAQIETATTDDPLDEILAERPDVAFVGTTDLTVDVALDRARVDARVEEIAAAAAAADVPLGGYALDHPATRYLLVSSDLALLRAAIGDA
jgi:4-hydroxy-2-oxoheptanedioate aldolase